MSESRLNAAQLAAVAELLRIAPVADRLGELFAGGRPLSSTWSAAASATRCSAGSATTWTSPPRPGRTTIEALLRAFSPTVWTIGKEFGTDRLQGGRRTACPG